MWGCHRGRGAIGNSRIRAQVEIPGRLQLLLVKLAVFEFVARQDDGRQGAPDGADVVVGYLDLFTIGENAAGMPESFLLDQVAAGDGGLRIVDMALTDDLGLDLPRSSWRISSSQPCPRA